MALNYFEWDFVKTTEALRGVLRFLIRTTDEKETFLGISVSGWHELIIDEAPDYFCDEVSPEGKAYYNSSDLSRQGQILVSLVNRYSAIKKRLLKIINAQYDLMYSPSEADAEFFDYAVLEERAEFEPALI